MVSNIVIKISFKSLINDYIKAIKDNPQDPNLIGNVWLHLMAQLEFLQYKLDRYITIINRFFSERTWKQEVLEDIGEKILDTARDNATHGYWGTDSLRKAGISWQERAEVTKRLYEAKGYGNPSGLTTGKDGLINSLHINGEGNIFSVKPDAGYVLVGSKWRYAKLLEEGGYRNASEENLGLKVEAFSLNGTTFSPKKWLVEALGETEAKFLAQLMSQEWKNGENGTAYIPPRPFLKPALWSSIHESFIGRILTDAIIYNLNYLLQDLPNWSLGDDISIYSEKDTID